MFTRPRLPADPMTEAALRAVLTNRGQHAVTAQGRTTLYALHTRQILPRRVTLRGDGATTARPVVPQDAPRRLHALG